MAQTAEQREVGGKTHKDPEIPPYTAAEKAWLKQHYRGEFHFLSSYNLSIYDEEDRAEGRLIVRQLMLVDDGEADE